MDNITQLIRTEIKRQYRSVRQFSEKSGIPYSTLSNALSKGIGGTSYETVIKICNLLNLKQAHGVDFPVFNEHYYDIITMISALDEHAVHTIKTILNMEYDRCTKGKKISETHSGLTMMGQNLDAHEDFEEAAV